MVGIIISTDIVFQLAVYAVKEISMPVLIGWSIAMWYAASHNELNTGS